jgi:hypothetical protein
MVRHNRTPRGTRKEFRPGTPLRKFYRIRDCLVTRGSHVSLHLELQDQVRTDGQGQVDVADRKMNQSFNLFIFVSPFLLTSGHGSTGSVISLKSTKYVYVG